MKSLALALLAVLVVVLQGTWLQSLDLPLNAALLLILATAWWGGRVRATALGFWTGSLVGAMTGTSVAFALLYGLMGWTAGTLLRLHVHRGVPRAALLGASFALSLQGLENLIWIVAQHPPRIDPGFLLAQLLWNGLGMAVLVWLTRSLKLRAERSNSWTADWKPVAYGG